MLCSSVPLIPLYATESAGTPSAKSVLKTCTPIAASGRSRVWDQAGAPGVGKSTMPPRGDGAVPRFGHIRLPVGALEEKAALGGIGEPVGVHADVGVHPQRDPKA